MNRRLRRLVRKLPMGMRALRWSDRLRHARWIRKSEIFDLDWYQEQTQQTFRSDTGAIVHYLRRGRRWYLTPNLLFDPGWYDPEWWTNGGIDPLISYLLNGPGRHGPHALFDDAIWVKDHPDAARHRGRALGHFLTNSNASTPLPTGPGATAVTFGELHDVPRAANTKWVSDNRIGRSRRHAKPDWAADRAFRQRWRDVSVPTRGDGPLVSIVTPVRNRPTQILSAIASVQAQSMIDWEMIIVDDGSSDATPEVVDIIAASDPRVRLVRLDHAGVCAARNSAISAARGDYVAFLDSDNTWSADFLALMTAAMHESGIAAAYCVLESINGSERRYLSYEGGLADLEFGNHIDLNTLVVERPLLLGIGGFDPALRRMVDYDLVVRLARATTLQLLPFVGVHYDADDDFGPRISNTESPKWDDVVKNRLFIDWEQLSEDVAHRVPGLVSVLLVSAASAALTLRCVTHLQRHADEIEIVVLDNGGPRGTWVNLVVALHRLPNVKLTRSVRNVGPVLAANLAFAHSIGEFVAIASPELVVDFAWCEPLRVALQESGAITAQPLVLDEFGLISGAGVAPIGYEDETPPALLKTLTGFPQHDAERLGQVGITAAVGPLVLARASDFATAQGLDPLFDLDSALAAFALSAVGKQPGVLVPSVVVRSLPLVRPGLEQGAAPQLVDVTSGSRPAEATASTTFSTSSPTLWSAAGLEPRLARSFESEGTTLRLRRTEPRPEVPDNAPLRWAIKTAAPAGPVGDAWGDVHFAYALARALESLGQIAVVDRRESAQRPTAALDDVVLTIRGLDRMSVQPDSLNLIWVISHPDDVDESELGEYDHAFAASHSWAAKMTDLDVPVEALLQATDPNIFRPWAAEPDSGPTLVFVGSSHGMVRPIVLNALSAGLPVEIHGGGWEGIVPKANWVGSFVANDRLGAMYRSAGVVLNDHWDDMAREGFISNRLFDVVAAGGRAISDRVPGLTEVFGAAVATATSAAELQLLLTADGRPRAEKFPTETELFAIANRVRLEHSFFARAKRLIEVASEAIGAPKFADREVSFDTRGSVTKGVPT
jgi:glycosyltransferase involved in cell wall biosynthesis